MSDKVGCPKLDEGQKTSGWTFVSEPLTQPSSSELTLDRRISNDSSNNIQQPSATCQNLSSCCIFHGLKFLLQAALTKRRVQGVFF